MVILGYIIPKRLQQNDFVKSLARQFEEKGKLSKKQTHAIEDMLEIELDFYGSEFKPDPEDEWLCQEWDLLFAKYRRNRFRSTKGRNKCIRAMESIIDGEPNEWLIDEALGRNYQPYRRYR